MRKVRHTAHALLYVGERCYTIENCNKNHSPIKTIAGRVTMVKKMKRKMTVRTFARGNSTR